jgi:predicted metal-dependent HD superfamily phosphohydrolase
LALVCHDAVYDPASDANEETSAAMAVDLCHKYGADEGRVRDMVLATKWHAEEIDFTEPDTQLVLDIDLVNLGRSWERYHWAAVSIRLEYGDLSDALWKAGRSEFLRKMLARSAVYRTPHIGDEAAARANMERELRELEASAIR